MSFLTYAMLASCRLSLRGSIAMNDTIAAKCNDVGIHFLTRDQPTNAATMFRSAIKYKSDYVAAHTNLALSHIILEEFDQAFPVLLNAVLLDPKNFLNHFYLGVVHTAACNYLAASDAFENVIFINPTFEPAILRSALVFLLLNETELATERFLHVSGDTVHFFENFTAVHLALRL